MTLVEDPPAVDLGSSDPGGPAGVFEALSNEECYLAALLMDRSGLDIAEFLFTNPASQSTADDDEVQVDPLDELYGCWRAQPHQWGWWRREGKQQVDRGGRAIGKALDLDTLVETDGGLIRLGDVVVGDYVFDETCTLVEVIDVHETLHERRCLEVRFSDGAVIVADADHQWPVEGGPATSAELEERLADAPAGIALQNDERSVLAVVEVGTRPVRCITVASPSQIFLVGETLIPTYNSESILARIFAFPFSFPGEEMVLVGPEGKHLDTLTERLEGRILESRLMSELVKKRGGQIATHKPFRMTFRNGSVIYTALPGKTGTGVKGIHPAALEVDEAQDLPEAVWRELPQTVKFKEVPGAYWRVHGVSRGVRDSTFWTITEEDENWFVHKITKMHSVMWNGAYERGTGAKILGGYGSADYKRNVWGEHGDAMNRIFALDRLMRTVDTRDEEFSEYNRAYAHSLITPDLLKARLGDFDAQLSHANPTQVTTMLDMVAFPTNYLGRQGWVWWMGADLGIIHDPTEILVAAQYIPDADQNKFDASKAGGSLAVPPQGQTLFQVMARVTLQSMPAPLQIEVFLHLINLISPRAFSTDGTGLGIPMFQQLLDRAGTNRVYIPEVPELWTPDQKNKAKAALTVLKSYNFSEKVVVGIDPVRDAKLSGHITPAERAEKAGIKRVVKDHATDLLRDLVDEGRWRMPYDKDMVGQMNGATQRSSTEIVDEYSGRKRMAYGAGEFHVLDAARMLVLGHFQAPIEDMLADDKHERPPRPPLFGLGG